MIYSLYCNLNGFLLLLFIARYQVAKKNRYFKNVNSSRRFRNSRKIICFLLC
jgi:hypothetical protein